jgi:hypothetical protein
MSCAFVWKYLFVKVKVKVKVNFTLVQAMNPQRGIEV